MRTLKLFRGLKGGFTAEGFDALKNAWHSVLQRRASGDFSYDPSLQPTLTFLHKHGRRLQLQYFTDREDIARSYGDELVVIEVPLDDILTHFVVEFQSYHKRKDDFQIVYGVAAEVLHANRDRWNLSVEKV